MDSLNRYSVGIDISDRTACVCVMDRSGILEEFKITLDEESVRTRVPFIAPETGVVVFETGPRSAWLKRVFAKLGMRVVVADARKVKAIASSPTKTDRNDARILARLGLADELVGSLGPKAERLLHNTYVRTPDQQRVYDRLILRDQLVRRRGDFVRQVRAVVKGTGRTLTGTSAAFHLQRDLVGDDLHELLAPMFDVIEACAAAIARLDKQIEELSKDNPAVTRLRTADGVGPISGSAFFAVIGDPTRFSNVRDVGAYLGLVVKRDQSGKLDPALGISKCGNGFMRRLLVQCAAYILGPFGKDSALRTWGLKFIAEKGERSKKKARIAVARKLAVKLLSMWKNEQDWQPFPGQAPALQEPSATDGSADCVVPPDASEVAQREIAAAPTDPIQPCARPIGVRTDESAESRRDRGSRPPKGAGTPVSPKPSASSTSRPRAPTPSALVSHADAGEVAPCLPVGRRVPGAMGQWNEDQPPAGQRTKKKTSQGAPFPIDGGAAS